MSELLSTGRVEELVDIYETIYSEAGIMDAYNAFLDNRIDLSDINPLGVAVLAIICKEVGDSVFGVNDSEDSDSAKDESDLNTNIKNINRAIRTLKRTSILLS